MKKKTLYIIAGIAVAAVAGIAVFGGGQLFQGRLGNLNLGSSRGAPTAPATGKDAQAYKINPSSVDQVTVEPFSVKILATDNTYKNNGKNLNLVNYRITATDKAITLGKYGSSSYYYNVFLRMAVDEPKDIDKINFENCSMNVDGKAFKDMLTTASNMEFLVETIIQPYTSKDFSLFCDVVGAESGDYFFVDFGRLDYLISNTFYKWTDTARGPDFLVP